MRRIGMLILMLVCILALRGWSEPLSVSCTNVVETPAAPAVGYLKSYIDPVFGSKVTRITGDPGSLIPGIDSRWDVIARHRYSKDSAWNCDQSLICLGRHHGFPSKLFLDGTTYLPLFGRNKTPGTESRWHPGKPDCRIYVKDNTIGLWNVRDDTTETLASLEGYSGFRIGPWEGNLSQDGGMIVVEAKREEKHVVFAYDLLAKRKYPDILLDDVKVDWVSISASGKHVVLNGRISGERGDQTQVYDLKGGKVGSLWSEYGRPSHYDLTVDGNGDDVAVGVSKSKPDDGRVIKRRLRDGQVTVLTVGGYASHTSTRNVRRPGWAYVSYQHCGPTWPPYWGEVVAVKLDGSMKVERIAHLHAQSFDYLTEAHAVPSPDGRRVLWAASHSGKTGRPVSTYVAELPK